MIGMPMLYQTNFRRAGRDIAKEPTSPIGETVRLDSSSSSLRIEIVGKRIIGLFMDQGSVHLPVVKLLAIQLRNMGENGLVS
jgi:hypothetical protein